MPYEAVYCDVCRKNLATFSLMQDVDGHTVRRRLCRECATREGSSLDWLQGIEEQTNGFPGDTSLPAGELGELAPDDFDGMDEAEAALFAEFDDDELLALFEELEPALEELDSTEAEAEVAELLADGKPDDLLLPEVFSKRCPKCDTTWDRLREDGRVGCAHCYEAFEEKLMEVMGRMQRETHHVGKVPVARLKRRQRLEHLRKQRDHRLEMLKNRLKEAVSAENYEDAAALRDKIKMVESTIVEE